MRSANFSISDEKFWQQPLAYKSQDIKLMVKRVFITSELGENSLPKWASWVKVVVDGKQEPLHDLYPTDSFPAFSG